MVNTIFILDEQFKTSRVLTVNGENTFFNDLYSSDLSTCAETFEFSTNITDISETDYIMFYYHREYKLFQITEIEQEHQEGEIITTVYSECALLELLNKVVRKFEGEFNCISFFNYILAETRWGIGKYSSDLAEKVVNIQINETTQIWSLMQKYMSEFGYEFSPRVTYGNGHVKGFYIDIFSEGELGRKTYKRFEYGRNVTGIVKKKDLYEFCTALILDTDKDVTDIEYNNKGYVKEEGSDVVLATNENKKYNYGRSYIYANFKDNDSQSGEEVVTKAVEELKRRATPHFDYEVTTAMTFEEYDDVNLGDTVYVIDNTFDPVITLEAKIGELQISFTDRNNCKCNLTNYKEIKSKINPSLTVGIQDIINTYFPITSDKLAPGSVDKDKINTQTYDIIIADSIGANKIVTEELIAKEIKAINGHFENIEAEHGEFKNLTAENFTAVNAKIDNLEVGDLKAINAEIENLKATKAEITDLNATKANIKNLNAEFADIKTLVNGNLTSDNILSFEITADKVTMDDAFIKDAHIANINASKINAGTINTANVSITSEDGGISIADETMQFVDENGKVRIQMGRDTNNNFTFALYDETGQGQLINADGIQSSDAIKDGLIRNGHVSDDANISGSKLDISSVITEVNNDTSATIKSNKIYLDEQNQSLEVAFNSLKTQVETIQDVTIDGDLSSIVEQVHSNTTEINVCKEGISTLVAENTTLKETVTDLNGDIVEVNNTLTSKYASLEQSVNGFKTSVADTYATKSTVNDLENNLTTNYSTTSAMNSAINQSKSEITTTVSSTYATKTSVNDLENNLTTNYSTTTDMHSAIEQKANSILSTVSSTYVSSEELDALDIGTRNLLRGTSEGRTLTGDHTENQYIWLYDITDPSLLAGKTATLTFQYTLSNWNGQGGIKAQTGYSTYDQFKQEWFWSEGTYTYTSTITFSSTNTDSSLLLRADWLGGTVKILPKTAILVLSDKKADWSQAPEDIIDNISSVEQKADKISWLVKSGTSESNMVLTDSMYSLITENITLSADNIKLEGYISANNNFEIDLWGNMKATNGTFSGTITGSTLATEAVDSKYVKVETSDYSVYNGSNKVISMGLRDIGSGATSTKTTNTPMIYMGASGLNVHGGASYTGSTGRYYGRWIVFDHNTSIESSSAYYRMPYMEFNFNTSYTNESTGSPNPSALKFMGNGDMLIAPTTKLEIRSHFKNGSFDGGTSETVISSFETYNNTYYKSGMTAQCIINRTNGNGLILADRYFSADGSGDSSTTGTFWTAVVVDSGQLSDGSAYRTFKPMHDGATDLGNSNARWRNIYATNGSISTSDRRAKENIQYLSNVENISLTTDEDYAASVVEYIKNIPYATFNMKEQSDEHIGFILQDLLQINPDLTNELMLNDVIIMKGEEDDNIPLLGYRVNNYINMLGITIQNLLKRIEVLENGN